MLFVTIYFIILPMNYYFLFFLGPCLKWEYKYSTVVDPTTYESHGLCDGILLRHHKGLEPEEIGVLRCLEHWRGWVGPLGFYKGGMGPGGISWPLPSPSVCLSDSAYAVEMAFLHDGPFLQKTLKLTSGALPTDNHDRYY
ncbi:hypothetical protein BDV59DRAFT_200951 [Aspergillus ambiguus]|uniref:uncharacterized protein n=1 Tax=Aspergillus ambiguus TaxID=176160 RepID=UPI003CCCC384